MNEEDVKKEPSESAEYAQLRVMIDALPLCCSFWDENFQNIDCNEQAVKLFGLSNKQEYKTRFCELSPEYQPDGTPSQDQLRARFEQTLKQGKQMFEWMHQTTKGEPLPVEISLVTLEYNQRRYILSYIRDLREEKTELVKSHSFDKSVQLIFAATFMSCSIWDKNIRMVDCNEEAYKLFDLSNKQEYRDRFMELFPAFQPDGTPSRVGIMDKIKYAFDYGQNQFEWMRQNPNKEQIPTKITLVRVKWNDQYFVVKYSMDLREQKANLAKLRKADERAQIVLDSMPIACTFWASDLNIIDCNQEAVQLFDLQNKQEYIDRFFEFSPEYQPDGSLSKPLALEKIQIAFTQGRCVFEWMHQKLSGEQLPSKIALVRVKRGKEYIIVGYTRDLRAEKAHLAKIREADERAQIMLDSMPLGCNFWDENLVNIDCNQAVVNLFELKDKKEFLDRFLELSPIYQPDRQLSSKKAMQKITNTFKYGSNRFEWMHQKLNGEQIPAEITLVRVKNKDHYIVVSYIRDLREVKASLTMLKQLERLAFVDSLTGVYNRRYLMENALKEFQSYKKKRLPFSVIIFDIDLFKNVNDTYGHAAGDEILKKLSARVQSVLRSDDLLARYGGEEFVILVNSDNIAAVKLAWRICEEVAAKEFEYMGHSIPITISLGVATSENYNSLSETIKSADAALYRAKERGRNRVET